MELRPGADDTRAEPAPLAQLDGGARDASGEGSTRRAMGGRPAARRPASAQVVEILKEEIRSGRIPGGDRLDQLRLAERMGVSRTPVREAFYILEAEGWIARTQYRHAVVMSRDQDDLRDQLDLTGIVYAAVLGKAARAGAPEREDLASVADGAGDPELRDRPSAFAAVNQNFLERAVVIARSARFSQASRLVSSGHLQGFFCRAPSAIEVQQAGLAEMATAIRAGDPDAARVAMRNTCAAHLRHLTGE